MNLSQRIRARCALAPVSALFFFLLSEPAWAYLDPGTGSMIISAVVGLFATVGLAVKTYWYKLKGLLRRNATEAGPDEDAQAAGVDQQQADAQRRTES